MPTEQTFHIAIIGSGPAGCFSAQMLSRALPNAHVTLFDRLASPFGLVRYGVAADHQHTKTIIRQFERLFAHERIRFAGNVDIGTDLSLEELRQAYDAVIIATGLSGDRTLGIPGDQLEGVVGAGVITRLLNSHPHETTDFPDLGQRTVLIGGGNVAMDLLRFLLKEEQDYHLSDISDVALKAYLASPVEHITLAQRSEPEKSKASTAMVKELADLPRGTYRSNREFDAERYSDRSERAKVAAFAAMVAEDRGPHAGATVDLRFGYVPVRVLGDSHVTGVEFAHEGDVVTVEADSVITAIGFTPRTGEFPEITSSPQEDGRITPGLYRTGWARRGPTGAIPENRACAKLVSTNIVDDISTGALIPDKAKRGYLDIEPKVANKMVSFEAWQKIDSYETSSATATRVRTKIADHDQMINIAHN